MTKVLVPVDGSQAAIRALRYAMAVANEIQIINVQQKADAPALLLHMTQAEIDKVQCENGASMLADGRRLLEGAGRPYQEHVLIGDPAPEIVRVAKAEGVDMIVMGTRGMNAFGNLALGSTATKVVHLAEIPVTLINERAAVAAADSTPSARLRD